MESGRKNLDGLWFDIKNIYIFYTKTTSNIEVKDMSKSLLLGNGINNHIGITELSETKIKERFLENVCNSSCVIESLFGVKVNYDIYDNVTLNINNYGIESLGGVIYKYIKENTPDQWIDNYELDYRT